MLRTALIISLVVTTTPCYGDALSRAAVDSGKYLLVVNGQPYVLSVGLVPTIEPLQLLCDLEDPVDPTDPPVEDEFSKKLALVVGTINEPVLAASMGSLFNTLADQIESGDLKDVPVGHIGDVTTQAVDVLMWATKKKPQWTTVREAIGEELADRAQKGTLDYAEAYREIAAAMDANLALNPLLIGVILKVVMAIISGEGLSIELIMEIVNLITKQRMELGIQVQLSSPDGLYANTPEALRVWSDWYSLAP